MISLLLLLAGPLTKGQDISKPNYGYPLMKIGQLDTTLLIGHTVNTSHRLMKIADLPVAVDNTAFMPPVGNQGNENSCTGFAVAYAMGEARNKELGYSLDNQFSPSFIYNLSNFQDNGSLMGAALTVVTAGCSKLSDFPYIERDWQNLPTGQVLDRALNNSVNNIEFFMVGDSVGPGWTGGPGYDGVNEARALLAAGRPVVMSLALTNDYGPAMQIDNWIYSYALASDMPFVGGHALCVVGYNDTLRTRDGRGAFRVINSWGADVFDGGYSWISYQVLAEKNYTDMFCTFTPQPENYQPEFKVEFSLKNFLNMAGPFYRGLVVKNQKYQKYWLWVYRYGNVTSQNGQSLIPQPLPDTSLVDMTDMAQHIDTTSGAENKFFISGYFYKSLFNGVYPQILSVHLIDKAKGVDTVINANITIQDSVFYAEWAFKTGTITGVTDTKPLSMPASYSLSQNYPNPFNPTTTISFSLLKSGRVTLKVYDLLGREVATLINGYESAGAHNTKFDASHLSSGIYLYRIEANGFAATKKMILMK